MEFSGHTVMITGAAVGIGRACALLFAEKGANLALVDMNEAGLQKLKEELSAYPVKVFTSVCDVSDADRVKAVFAKAGEAAGPVDILINNAALWRNFAPFLETPDELWDRYLDINVKGVVYCTKAVLPGMIDKGFGRIINVASVAGVYGIAKMAAYSATKGALISMTKSLAREVAKDGITVNSVAPGTVSSSEESDIDYTSFTDMNYMERTGSDRENADLICFLAGEKAGYISGQNIQIDGVRKKL